MEQRRSQRLARIVVIKRHVALIGDRCQDKTGNDERRKEKRYSFHRLATQ